MTTPDKQPEVALVTGFDSLLARRICRQLLEDRPSSTVNLLVPEELSLQAGHFVEELPAHMQPRCQVLEGAPTSMNLGVSSDTYRQLASLLVEIHHASELADPTAGQHAHFHSNVEGTREMLELASSCGRLERFCHWSTTQVSGTRSGVVMEDELECRQGFANSYQRSKLEAERLVRRWARRLPVTVFRPALLSGDSETGEADHRTPVFQLLRMLVSGRSDLSAVIPTGSSAPLNLVPVDFATRAAAHLARTKQGVGATFHLVDPAPYSVRRFCELVARKAHRQPPKSFLPAGLARLLPRVPLVSRFTDALPEAVSSAIDQMVFFNCRNTLDALRPSGITCPPLATYVERMVRYVRQAGGSERSQPEEEIPDPLA
jgi:thioester reductase-like protein